MEDLDRTQAPRLSENVPQTRDLPTPWQGGRGPPWLRPSEGSRRHPCPDAEVSAQRLSETCPSRWMQRGDSGASNRCLWLSSNSAWKHGRLSYRETTWDKHISEPSYLAGSYNPQRCFPLRTKKTQTSPGSRDHTRRPGEPCQPTGMLTCSPAHTCLLARPPEDIHELVALTGCSPGGKSPGLGRPLLNDLSSKVSRACAPRVSAGGLTSQGWALFSRPASCDHRPLTAVSSSHPRTEAGVGSQVIQGHLVGLPTPPLPRFSLQGRACSWEGPGCPFQLGPCPSLAFPTEPLVQRILSWGLLCRELKLAHSPLLPCLATLWPPAGLGPRSSEGSWSCSPAGPGTRLQSEGSWPLGQDARVPFYWFHRTTSHAVLPHISSLPSCVSSGA